MVFSLKPPFLGPLLTTILTIPPPFQPQTNTWNILCRATSNNYLPLLITNNRNNMYSIHTYPYQYGAQNWIPRYIYIYISPTKTLVKLEFFARPNFAFFRGHHREPPAARARRCSASGWAWCRSWRYGCALRPRVFHRLWPCGNMVI